MTVRPIGEDDAPAIAEVERAAAYHPWRLAQVRATLALPTTRAWGLEVAGQLVGHLITTEVIDEAEVLTIAVAPLHRRQGHAVSLLTHAEGEWRARGITTAWLEVRVSNEAARALYVKQGWVDVGVRPRYYADGTDAAQMRWEAP